jgi:hypothetical protein
MICSLDIVIPLLDSLHNGQVLQIISVIVLFSPWQHRDVKLTSWRIPQLAFGLSMPVIPQPVESRCRIINIADWKCFRRGESVVAVFDVWKVSLASRYHFHLSCLDILEFSVGFSRSYSGIVTFANLFINCQ